MRTSRLFVLAFAFPVLAASSPAADDAKRPPPAPIKQDRIGRVTAAVEAMELALVDLPPGAEKEQIRIAVERLRIKLDAIKIARSEMDQQHERAAWAERMAKKGYMTQQQADAEKSKLNNYELTLQKLKKDLEGLSGHPKERMRNLLQDIDEAEQNLQMQQERVAWAARMVKKGYLPERCLQDERALLREYEMVLERLKRTQKAAQDDLEKPVPAKK